jgi:hypothetical protein
MSSIRKLGAIKSDQDEEEKAERRLGIERRRFSYSVHIPERRTGSKRRKETERHSRPDQPMAQDIDE